MRAAAVILIVLAILAIAIGRAMIRRAKRMPRGEQQIGRRRYNRAASRLLGWSLVFWGVVLMTMGVVIW